MKRNFNLQNLTNRLKNINFGQKEDIENAWKEFNKSLISKGKKPIKPSKYVEFDDRLYLIHLETPIDTEKYLEKISDNVYKIKPHDIQTSMIGSDSTKRVCCAGSISNALESIDSNACNKVYNVFIKDISDESITENDILINAEQDVIARKEIDLIKPIIMTLIGKIKVDNNLNYTGKIDKSKYDSKENAKEIFESLTGISNEISEQAHKDLHCEK